MNVEDNDDYDYTTPVVVVQEITDERTNFDWIHDDDCLEFYHRHLEDTSTTGGSTSSIMHCRKRVNLMRICLTQAYSVRKQQQQHDCCDAQFFEFGVHKGHDITRMSAYVQSLDEKNRNPANKNNNIQQKKSDINDDNNDKPTIFHGFDSFVGLPEDWRNGQTCADGSDRFQAGAFSTNGREPDIATSNSSNIIFHKGWFADTLPRYLDSLYHDDNNNNNNDVKRRPVVAFVHADADVYSSTKTVLDEICQRKLLVAGTVLLFDEFWNYEGWKQGEYKAWCEAVNQYNLSFRYFGVHTPSSNNSKKNRLCRHGYQSVAVCIERDMI